MAPVQIDVKINAIFLPKYFSHTYMTVTKIHYARLRDIYVMSEGLFTFHIKTKTNRQVKTLKSEKKCEKIKN